ncbi:flagellar basal-body MS-ring/collar protein FliF [Roseicella sp. DB1501]|uniref:flagellar basal-body MS-ring/collar protein FliF n=1 Tax=Roseicella sp. DB1501 TaxID=2730925 RepID=UPI0014913B82|nr:flagellar basal-body MS-ring/collar protein FliF [Roseicella sp. DB1501]NOG71824.1 flagellar M-ring protein FliF [Roseicella sp. DB1501]
MGGVIAGLKALGPKRLLALGGVGVVLLGLLAVLALRASEPEMAPLFGELEPRDAAAVVAALERQKIPYRLAAGGTQVLAPAEQAPRLRLLLAREGLPAGGGVGWEIFDRGESLTTTPFQQDVNKLRALEGELARTIRGIAGVRAARVHLVLPRREAFSRERGEAQASVVLAMQGTQRLDAEGVQAVLHLVATAVPGLKPQHISVVDSRGTLLARGGQTLAGAAMTQSQEELRRAQEMRLGRAVEELLERSLGAGRVRAEATVEMDFDRIETREERFDPENQVARSQQSSSEQNRGAEPPPTTVAGNLPGTEPPGGGGSQENRSEETTNFEIGRTTRNTLREHPVIRRISLAVLVDGVTEPAESSGPPRWRERSAEELARIATLARSAIGFDEKRGDKVEVVSMRFAEEALGAEPPERFLGLPLSPALGTRLVESALLALVALLAILLIGRPMVGRITASLMPVPALAGAGGALPGSMLPGAAEEAAALPGGETAALPPGAAGEGMVSLAHVQGQMRASSLNALVNLVQSHPDESLAVIRRWLDPENAR